MTKNTTCGVCGNKYTVEVTYCLNCGAVVGKSTAEVRELVNTYIPDRYIPSRLEKIKAVLDKMRFSPHDAILLPFYHKVTISKPRFPRFLSKFPALIRNLRKTTMISIEEPMMMSEPELIETVVKKTADHYGPPPVGGGPFYIHDGDGNVKTINEARYEMGLANINRGDQAKPKYGTLTHGKDVFIIIEVNGKEFTMDYVTNMHINITDSSRQFATIIGSDAVMSVAGNPTAEVILEVLVGGAANINFWQSLIGPEVKLTVWDRKNDTKSTYEGTGLSFSTNGRAGEYMTGKFVFRARYFALDVGPAEVEIPHAAILIGRLENDYPFLTMKDHQCEDLYVDKWNVVGNHAVCDWCGRMMARNLPELSPAKAAGIAISKRMRAAISKKVRSPGGRPSKQSPSAFETGPTYGSSSVKEFADQVSLKLSADERVRKYFKKGAVSPAIFKAGLAPEFTDDIRDAFGVAMHAAKAGEQVAVRSSTYRERYGAGLAVSKPDAAVKMSDLE